MILDDIYAYLKNDEALSLSLGASEDDSKIYPNFARISSRAPYIIYRSSNPGGSSDEVLSEEALTLVITSESFAKTVEISRLLTGLLDLTEQQIPSQGNNIYYCKKIGGNDFIDELGRHSRALNFIFKFQYTGD